MINIGYINALKNIETCVRTPKGNDIDGFNPYGNQVMHHQLNRKS
jgi:hypothetical protein